MATPALVVIVGETASGKSDLAMVLAKTINGEIICADSRTIYKKLDIGTAKPTKKDQQQVPHHMLDVVEPSQTYNVSQFKVGALKAIKSIVSRGKVPILVGGSGLYIDAVVYDYEFSPKQVSLSKREQLENSTLQDLQQQAYALNIDESQIDFKNRRHLQRAVEAGRVVKQTKKLRSNTIVVGVHRDKNTLEQRITARIDNMIERGFVDEVKSILAEHGSNTESLTGIGYRAFAEYVEHRCTLEDAKQKFIKGDLRLAKKQRTWFKRNKSIRWSDDPKELVEVVTTFLNT